ncbi:unnamed protein product [Periconia digitata]|uniref:Uncharacterized protein n=1 Tax=Periconia digitata TaxID=1303443 RepID=A0A9W4UAT0_9PLEO|nr:unnamed protein product [Periconia digitata]
MVTRFCALFGQTCGRYSTIVCAVFEGLPLFVREPLAAKGFNLPVPRDAEFTRFVQLCS